MAKRPTSNKTVSRKGKAKDKELEVQEIQEVEDVEEVDTDEETEDVEEKDSAEAFVDKMMSDEDSDEDDDADDDADEVVVDKVEDDSMKATQVLVLKDTDRFFVGTQWIENLKRDEKLKLPKHVAEHLQERGRVKIV
jgi:hypothetical protein